MPMPLFIKPAGFGAATTPSSGSTGGVTYTASQSSDYGGIVGTYANLTDSNGTTGTITYPGSEGWIQATYASPVLVTHVKVGGGNITNIGGVADEVNHSKLQYSTNNSTWTDVLNFSGITDSGANQFKTFTLPTPITAQYWRIASVTGSGYFTGTTELVFT